MTFFQRQLPFAYKKRFYASCHHHNSHFTSNKIFAYHRTCTYYHYSWLSTLLGWRWRWRRRRRHGKINAKINKIRHWIITIIILTMYICIYVGCARQLTCLPNRCLCSVDSRFLSSCRHYYIHFSMLISRLQLLTFCALRSVLVGFSLSPAGSRWSCSLGCVCAHHNYSLLSNDVPFKWRERSNKLDSLPLSHSLNMPFILLCCCTFNRTKCTSVQACRVRAFVCVCVSVPVWVYI